MNMFFGFAKKIIAARYKSLHKLFKIDNGDKRRS